MAKRTFIKLMVIQLTANKLSQYLPSGIIPDGAKIMSIKARKTGKTMNSATLESGAGFDGLVLGLKRVGSDVDIEIPLSSIYNRSVNGDCAGLVFPEPTTFNFGDTGSELKSYDAGTVTTGNAVELEIQFYKEF